MIKRLKLIPVVIVMMVLGGCGSDEPARTVAPAAKKDISRAEVAPPADALSESAKEKEYVYNPIGKRDPFENPLQAIVEVAPETGVPLTPLQKFDLGQLRLIGVIVGKGDPRGMVIAPDGKSFILSVGTKIGKNDGTVVEITTDAVLVKEIYRDFTGETRSSIQEIRLPKQGGVN